ncbi:MAG: hypothetical protein WC781_00870 [Candidatus Pacearchaeota archaeon]|jgi:hypothetical protein
MAKRIKYAPGDIRADRRWQLEAKVYGKNKATVKAIERIFQNEHYVELGERSRKQERWNNYVSKGNIDDLILTAKDLFELVENECKGVVKFVPRGKTWKEGIYTCVDFEGKGDKGYPTHWEVEGTSKLSAHLHYSSNVETEIWRRIVNHENNISIDVEVFGKNLSFETLNEYFENYHRDFESSHNSMPYHVESAFNHIPELNKQLKVEGFPYPHVFSNRFSDFCCSQA